MNIQTKQITLNGIDGASGTYLLPPLAVNDITTAIRGEKRDRTHLNDLALRYRMTKRRQRSVMAGVDPLLLSSAGWGVIFAYSENERLSEIREALSELLALRCAQAGERYKEFSGVDAYRPGETKNDFLARHGAGQGPVDPDKVPYYLLLVGSPEAIPYTFQYQLDVQYAVGRIWFDSPTEYASYARSVVETENNPELLPRKAAFFGVQNPDDPATDLSATLLVQPLATKLITDQVGFDWSIENVIGEQATKNKLATLLAGDNIPALLFSASHGMGFPRDDPRQVPHQGALLCQDWPGPVAWRGPIPEDHYFSADDLSPEAHLLGRMAFFFACFGAGTPRTDDFAHLHSRQPAEIARQAFVSRLPQRLLSHPKGGMLAVIGHVERVWGYSFQWEQSGSQLAVFESTLKRLLAGDPVGYAMEYFNERYAELSTVLTSELQGLQFGKSVDELALVGIWTANNDARSYVILGDPAARLPV